MHTCLLLNNLNVWSTLHVNCAIKEERGGGGGGGEK